MKPYGAQAKAHGWSGLIRKWDLYSGTGGRGSRPPHRSDRAIKRTERQHTRRAIQEST